MKKYFSYRIALFALAIASALCTPSFAADETPGATKTPQQAAPKTTMTIPKVLPAQELNRPLTDLNDYAAMMQKAGYNTRMGKTGDGKTAFSVLWTQGTWNFLVNFSLNEVGGQKYLSLVSPLATIPDMSKVPVASVVALMEFQDATLGWYFVLNKKSQRFFLARTLPAQGITTGLLLNELKIFESNAAKSQPFWDPATWPKTQPAPAASK